MLQKIVRHATHLDCPVQGNSACMVDKILSKPHGPSARADWTHCEHGYIVQVVITEWVTA